MEPAMVTRQGLLKENIDSDHIRLITRKPVTPTPRRSIHTATERDTIGAHSDDHELQTLQATQGQENTSKSSGHIAITDLSSDYHIDKCHHCKPGDTILTNNLLSVDRENEAEILSAIDQTRAWRPKWLRPAILTFFAFVFLSFAIALAAMLWYSLRNNGIMNTRQSFGYVWRFGPTGVLTTVAIFWARVELQGMMYMPWVALRGEFSLGQAKYALDYTSMIPPIILFRSMQNKHYLVFFVVIISFLLKTGIVLAPGLYSLATIRVAQAIELGTLDFFDVESEVEYRRTTLFDMAKTLEKFEMAYPYGVASNLAYQTFRKVNDSSRGSPTHPITAVVDGFFYEMDCLRLEEYFVTDQKPSSEGDKYLNITMDIRFEGCDMTLQINNDGVVLPEFKGNSAYWISTSLHQKNNVVLPERPCPNLPQQYPQILLLASLFNAPEDKSPTLEVIRVAGALCAPSIWLSKVKVTDNGISPVINLLPDHDRKIVSVNPWDIFDRIVPGSGGLSSMEAGLDRVFGPVFAERTLRGQDPGGQDPDPFDLELYKNEVLYDSMKNITHKLGPLIGHYFFRRTTDLQPIGIGSVALSMDRLIVNKWTAISMMTLFVAAAGITLFLVLRYQNVTTLWHRNPASLMGYMIFFSDHPSLFNSARLHFDNSKFEWGRQRYSPIVFRVWIRALFAIFVVMIIGSLIVSLRISNLQLGLFTVDDDGYLHLLWTSLPALVAIGVSIFVGSCDKAYRDLSALFRLSLPEVDCRSRELDITLLDMLGLRVLLHSVRQRLWSVTLSQLLVFFGGFLTTLVSVLFTTEIIPESKALQLQPKNWFYPGASMRKNTMLPQKRTLIGSLFLASREASVTYPKNTFDDLIFPDLEVIHTLDLSRNLSIKLTAPAAKLERRCRNLEQSKNEYNITLHKPTWDSAKPVTAVYREPASCPNGTKIVGAIRLLNSPAEGKSSERYTVARLINHRDNMEFINFHCEFIGNETDLTFATAPSRMEQYGWGVFAKDLKSLDFFTVWKCDYFWAEVMTNISMVFIDGELVIDPTTTPLPNLSTIRPWEPPFDVPPLFTNYFTYELENLHPIVIEPGGKIFHEKGDSRMQMLLEPLGPFTWDAFSDPLQQDAILDMLHYNYAFLAAQLANTENRMDISERPNETVQSTRPLLALEAIVTYNDRRRLVQNSGITFALVGILGVIAIFNMWPLISVTVRQFRSGSNIWFLDMDMKGLAPEGFRSIAAMASLLHGSNIFTYLPLTTELLSSDELHGQMSDLTFRLGWFRNDLDQERVYTIGVTGDSNFVFEEE